MKDVNTVWWAAVGVAAGLVGFLSGGPIGAFTLVGLVAVLAVVVGFVQALERLEAKVDALARRQAGMDAASAGRRNS